VSDPSAESVATGDAIQVEVLPDAEAVARRAAAVIAAAAREAVRARGRFLLATSGGSTPWRMLERLAGEDVPWPSVHLFQVDERVAPRDDAGRNLTHLRAALLDRVPIPAHQVHAMPVEAADLAGGAARYADVLRHVAGSPPVLDLVHLGLGSDGHTASLVPGDPALDVTDAEVALTGPYGGFRRMTLTYPVLEHARRILWVVTGPDKRAALTRLRGGDRAVPAGRVARQRSLLVADMAAVEPSAPAPVPGAGHVPAGRAPRVPGSDGVSRDQRARGATSDRNSRPAGLRLIVGYKFAKAPIMLVLALWLTAAPDSVLRSMEFLARELADGGMIWSRLGAWIQAHLTGTAMTEAAVLAWLDAASTALEGILLLTGKAWAEWIVVVSLASLVPLELLSMETRPGLLKSAVLVINVAIVIYLVRRRTRKRRDE